MTKREKELVTVGLGGVRRPGNAGMQTWKVCDNSGCRRHDNPLTVVRRLKNVPALGERVHVIFDDEYVRNGCSEAYEENYIVASIDLDGGRNMYTVALTKEAVR